MNDLVLYNTIKQDLLRKQLFQGTAIAAFGALLLLWGGTMLPEEVLNKWGIPLFLSSTFLIGYGLIPYRKLKKLETTPYKIQVTEEGELLFFQGTKHLLSIMIHDISKTSYKNVGSSYGICLWLKTGKNLPFTKKFGCDLFLPYFSKKSYEQLLYCLPVEDTT